MENIEDPARIPAASVMVVSSGNIINYSSLKRKIPQSSTEEVSLSLTMNIYRSRYTYQ